MQKLAICIVNFVLHPQLILHVKSVLEIYYYFTETTEAPGTNCAAPQWFGDDFCDDENNTADCGFDGGDCCNNEGPGWNNYCTDCECLA